MRLSMPSLLHFTLRLACFGILPNNVVGSLNTSYNVYVTTDTVYLLDRIGLSPDINFLP
jgi:hypothetical protein